MQVFIRNRIYGVGPRTGKLYVLASRHILGEVEWYAATRLRLRFAKIDGAGIDTRRRARLKAAYLES